VEFESPHLHHQGLVTDQALLPCPMAATRSQLSLVAIAWPLTINAVIGLAVLTGGRSPGRAEPLDTAWRAGVERSAQPSGIGRTYDAQGPSRLPTRNR
jgi:hypothetical protein